MCATSHSLAYVPGRTSGVVRLIHRELAERALIKGYSSLVTDIAFAHTDHTVLASMDEDGSLFVHAITLEGRAIMYPFHCLLCAVTAMGALTVWGH